MNKYSFYGKNYSLCRNSMNRGRRLLPKKKQELGLVIIDNNSSGNNRVVVIPSFRSRSMTPSGGTARGRSRDPFASAAAVSVLNANNNSANKTHGADGLNSTAVSGNQASSSEDTR